MYNLNDEMLNSRKPITVTLIRSRTILTEEFTKLGTSSGASSPLDFNQLVEIVYDELTRSNYKT